jgi:glucose-6-phosphate 1-epimerase
MTAGSTRIEELNRQVQLSGCAEVVAGNAGFPKLRLQSQSSIAEIYLYGAQVTSWKVDGGDEVLFLSDRSHWEDGRPIRGGIPICFPWFRAKADDPQAPSHGFVRSREWRIESVGETSNGVAEAILSTESDKSSKSWWPFDFRLEYRVSIGNTLGLELEIKNTGADPLRFEEALHTYFRVSDVERVRVSGLDGLHYLDNRDGNREKTQSGDLFITQQTDNAYLNANGSVEIVDPVRRRIFRTEKRASASTIVWNPWNDGAATLADFEDKEWRHMLCVEGGNILQSAVSLEPGESQTMAVAISLGLQNS